MKILVDHSLLCFPNDSPRYDIYSYFLYHSGSNTASYAPFQTIMSKCRVWW